MIASLYSNLMRSHQQRAWPAFVYVALSRLVLLALLLIIIALTQKQPDWGFYMLFASLAFLSSIPISWRYRNARTNQAFSYQYFIVDVLVVTGVVHFTGGIRSQLLLLYPLVILAAGIVGSGKLAVKTAFLSIVLYATLLFLEMESVLVYRGPPPFPYDAANVVMQNLLLRALLFAFFAAAAVFLCSRSKAEETSGGTVDFMQFIFDHVAAALLAFDQKGNIIIANSAAAKLLGSKPEKLRYKNFFNFFVSNKPDLENTDGINMWELRDNEDREFKAAAEISAVQLPDTYCSESDSTATHGFIAVLWNMTEVNKVQESESSRLQVAMDVASEVAHYVRNPLTAIKLADEMMLSLVGNRPTSNGKNLNLTSSELSLIASMCQVISDETQELEDRVNNFLNCKDEAERTSLKKLIEDADAAKLQLSRHLE